MRTLPDYVRPTELEIATASVVGTDPGRRLPTGPSSPLEALEDAIRPALLAPPCRVAFSGGRDSSAVLAVATRVARREGLPLPVPVTRVYPDAPRSDEDSWQRLVIDHLRLPDWNRLAYRHEHEFLAAAARRSLRSRGLLWPPALHIHDDWYATLGPGSMLTGEGGDDVLGARRVAPVAGLLSRARPSRTLVRQVVGSVAPRAARRALHRRRLGARPRPWLRPAVDRRVLDAHVEDIVREPLRYDRSVRAVARRRCWSVYVRNHGRLAADHGIRVHDPLLDDGFVAALADSGGAVGFTGRTAAMRALFGHLLPAECLSRRSKALFNEVYMGSTTQAFARDWDGSGVNEELVDADALRAEWLSDRPSPSTSMLLQQAWLNGPAGLRGGRNT